MGSFDQELESDLAAIEARGLLRQLRRIDSPQSVRIRVAGQDLLNFASNDYLGLADHPLLKEAACAAVAQYGAGSGASRLICGSLAPHDNLEQLLAQFKGTEAALTFSTGYAAALGTIGALMGKDDVIILDRLVHACIVDAARLSGAKIRVFAHNNLENLERLLHWADARNSAVNAVAKRRGRILIVTESVFSMDGDLAPLAEIVALKNRYGAWLMVDEAHATGLFGKHRRGVAESLNVSDQVEVQMGTLGKALGASGGYICGSRRLVDLLVNKARSFIFSTAPIPAAAAAAAAGLRLAQSETGSGLCRALWQQIHRFTEHSGGSLGAEAPSSASAIIPLIIGDERRTLEVAASLRRQNLFVPAIRYPTVARGKARLRVTLTAKHTSVEIDALLQALRAL